MFSRLSKLRVTLLRFGLLATLLVFCAASVFGQAETSQITGTVYDPSGAAIPNATITVKSVDTGTVRELTTSTNGTYLATDLLPGNYLVSATAPGFVQLQQRITLTVGAKQAVDMHLEVGKASTVVEVNAAAIQVNTETQTLSTVVDQNELRELPTLTRNPYALVAISGNASDGGVMNRGVGFAINGQRESSTNVLLDGAANNDEFTTGPGQSVPLDSIQEFSILTNNFTAEFGRASGGVVNVVTKSGSNAFHGTAYEFNRVSDLSSNSFSNNAYSLPKSVFTRNQFGYSAGGPIKKDKLFFFSSTEWIRIRSNANTEVVLPDANLIAAAASNTQQFFSTYGKLAPGANILSTYSINQIGSAQGSPFCGSSAACNGLNPNSPMFDLVAYSAPGDAGGGIPENGYQNVERIDYNLTDKTQIYGRYAVQRDNLMAGTVSSSPYQGFNTGAYDFNNNMLFSVIHTFNPAWVLQSKAVFNRINGPVDPFGQYPAVPTLYVSSSGAGSVLGNSIVFPGYDPFTPGAGIPFGGPQNYAEVYEDASWTRGRHSLRFGGSYEYIRDNRTFGAYETAGEYLSQGNVGSAIGNFLAGQLSQFQVAIYPQGKFPGDTVNLPLTAPNFSRSNRYNNPALYVQDAWKVTPRFTLNLGLRWEYFGVQHNKNPQLDSNYYAAGLATDTPQGIAGGSVQIAPNSPIGGLWKSDWKDFAPRVGFAWDIFGDGKTSFRGGYGIGYERNFGNVTFNVIQNPPNNETVSVFSSQMPLPISTSNYGPFSGSSGTLTLPTASLRNVDPEIKTAYAHLWSLSVERQLTRSVLIAADYSGSKGVHLYDISDMNYYGYGNVYLGQPCSYAASQAFYLGTGGTAGVCNAVLNPQYGPINVRGDKAYSMYNGLTLRSVINNIANSGLQLNFNYTWSHSTDNLSSSFSDTNGLAASGGDYILGLLNPFEPNIGKGNSDFDTRQRVVVSAVWTEPAFKHGHGLATQLLGGWSLSPIFTARTGSPYSIFDCTWNYYYCPYAAFTSPVSVNGSGAPPAITSTPNTFNFLPLSTSSMDHFTNPTYFFSDLPPYPNDMTGRNTFRGPGYWNLNVGVYKTFNITERFKLQLRGEAYNLFNHSNLYVDGAAADTLTTSFIPACYGCAPVGTPQSENDRRNLQLAAKLIF
ncbi:MAG TPA: carboxypeptidase regulatory-like domain-containing protein [Bryobacteraceae bacterium]|nr:carboxypeptidase regulatory-like domain-containing protein [Bryobacteraceae bacterium]